MNDIIFTLQWYHWAVPAYCLGLALIASIANKAGRRRGRRIAQGFVKEDFKKSEPKKNPAKCSICEEEITISGKLVYIGSTGQTCANCAKTRTTPRHTCALCKTEIHGIVDFSKPPKIVCDSCADYNRTESQIETQPEPQKTPIPRIALTLDMQKTNCIPHMDIHRAINNGEKCSCRSCEWIKQRNRLCSPEEAWNFLASHAHRRLVGGSYQDSKPTGAETQRMNTLINDSLVKFHHPQAQRNLRFDDPLILKALNLGMTIKRQKWRILYVVKSMDGTYNQGIRTSSGDYLSSCWDEKHADMQATDWEIIPNPKKENSPKSESTPCHCCGGPLGAKSSYKMCAECFKRKINGNLHFGDSAIQKALDEGQAVRRKSWEDMYVMRYLDGSLRLMVENSSDYQNGYYPDGIVNSNWTPGATDEYACEWKVICNPNPPKQEKSRDKCPNCGKHTLRLNNDTPSDVYCGACYRCFAFQELEEQKKKKSGEKITLKDLLEVLESEKCNCPTCQELITHYNDTSHIVHRNPSGNIEMSPMTAWYWANKHALRLMPHKPTEMTYETAYKMYQLTGIIDLPVDHPRHAVFTEYLRSEKT